MTWCNNLADGACGLSDGSTVGQWRLPNVRESESLLDYAYPLRICNTAGTDQWKEGDPFTNVQPSYYWTSTSYARLGDAAWYVDTGDSNGVSYKAKYYALYVWPVRGGQ